MFDQLDDPNPPIFGSSHRGAVRARVRGRQRRRLAVGGAAGAVVLGVTGVTARAVSRIDDVRRLDVAGLEQADPVVGAPVTVLLVGTDGASLADPTPESGRPDTRAMTDTILLARLDPTVGAIRLLSLPRDLDVAVDGAPVRRLNSVYAEQGVDGLVAEVTRLGVPVDHVAIVDFAGFVELVDAVGGIDVAVTSPVRDASSGLTIDSPGCRHLDGPQALALARARHLERFDGVGWVADAAGDLGRMGRQRALLWAAFADLGDQIPIPFTADRLAGWAQEHLTVDAGLGTAELVELIRTAAAIDPGRVTSTDLPVQAATRDGAAVLELLDATAVVDWFDGGAPTPAQGTATTTPGADGSGPPTGPVLPDADLIGPC